MSHLSGRKKRARSSQYGTADRGSVPPVTILITKAPYGTEYAFGALSFAVACAYQGIRTQVIFIEEGVYALTGIHRQSEDNQYYNLQEVIDAVAESENLQLYAYQPSLHLRKITKNKQIKAVMDIGKTELGQLLFNPPWGPQTGHQRVIFF